jgi:hypothetical protein
MQLINGVGVKTAEELFSQFPLWDFFECNKKRVPREDYDYGHRSLNSLCGISLNATLYGFCFERIPVKNCLSIPFVGFL